MWWCVTIGLFSVLVNGSPKGYFSNFRGVRQGDPLSSYLFIIGMEEFSVMVDKAVLKGLLSGYVVADKSAEADTLIFYKDCKIQLANLCFLLLWFGQKRFETAFAPHSFHSVSFAHSGIFSINAFTRLSCTNRTLTLLCNNSKFLNS